MYTTVTSERLMLLLMLIVCAGLTGSMTNLLKSQVSYTTVSLECALMFFSQLSIYYLICYDRCRAVVQVLNDPSFNLVPSGMQTWL